MTRTITDERERTCADCLNFAPITCDGEQTGRGLCAVDAEMVRSDKPACDGARPTRGDRECAGGDAS